MTALELAIKELEGVAEVLDKADICSDFQELQQQAVCACYSVEFVVKILCRLRDDK